MGVVLVLIPRVTLRLRKVTSQLQRVTLLE